MQRHSFFIMYNESLKWLEEAKKRVEEYDNVTDEICLLQNFLDNPLTTPLQIKYLGGDTAFNCSPETARVLLEDANKRREELLKKISAEKISSSPAQWTNSKADLKDGWYVGCLKDSGNFVFVRAEKGEFVTKEYCKNLTKWLYLGAN